MKSRCRDRHVAFSFGAGSRLVFAAVDKRFRGVVLIGAGIDGRVTPTLPEAASSASRPVSSRRNRSLGSGLTPGPVPARPRGQGPPRRTNAAAGRKRGQRCPPKSSPAWRCRAPTGLVPWWTSNRAQGTRLPGAAPTSGKGRYPRARPQSWCAAVEHRRVARCRQRCERYLLPLLSDHRVARERTV